MGRLTGQDSLERSVRAAGIDARPFWYDETGSTNDEALGLARQGAPDWTVVATGHQREGKGRLGRRWEDAPGRSLLCSILLRPRISPERAGLVTLLAATAMVEAAELPGLRSKWPNDLVVGERKCGGILAEARVRGGDLDHVVLGIGMNVELRPEDVPAELRDAVTSFAIEGASTDAETLLERFLVAFRDGFDHSPDVVPERYAAICSTIGRRVRAQTSTGQRVEGTASGIDERGGLIVEAGGARSVIAFGEVTHLR